MTRLQLQKDTKKCRKKRQGGLKETIKLMLIILLGLLNYNFSKTTQKLRQRIQNIIRWKIKITINQSRKFTTVEY